MLAPNLIASACLFVSFGVTATDVLRVPIVTNDLADERTLEIATKRAIPGASIVQPAEVDRVACKQVRELPSVVRGDFNGDGLPDYAVLTKTKVSKESLTWGDKVLREASFALVLFTATRTGEMRVQVHHRFDDFLPTASAISLQPPVTLRSRDDRKALKMQADGILFSLCEKSATVFFYNRGRVSRVTVAD